MKGGSPALAIIASMPKGKSKKASDEDMEDMPEDSEEDMDAGKEAAAEEAMAAVKADDPKAFAKALKAFVDLCY